VHPNDSSFLKCKSFYIKVFHLSCGYFCRTTKEFASGPNVPPTGEKEERGHCLPVIEMIHFLRLVDCFLSNANDNISEGSFSYPDVEFRISLFRFATT
jgi:hypothetical protein